MLFETSRLVIRRFTIDDAQAVYDFNSRSEVISQTGDNQIETLEEAKNIISNIWLPEYEKYGYARMAIVHKKDKKVIGFAGLKYEVEWNATDIGYRLLPEYWGKGIATEACLPFIFYGFKILALPKIVGAAFVSNPSSSRVLEKLGLKYLDTRKIFENSTDCKWYELRREDYIEA